MPELNPSGTYGTLGLALRARAASDLPGQSRPLEYFGGSAVAKGQTPTDNLTAFNAALDWCAETQGGKVELGGGVYGVDGPIPLQSYATLRGAGKFQTSIEQLSATPTDVLTSSSSVGEGIAFCDIQGLTVDGGWSPGWGVDRATHTAAGIRLAGPGGGPDDPTALAKEGVLGLADPFHVVRGVRITNVAGSGFVTTGRGEIQFIENYVLLCSLYGMHLGAPDCWFANNTVNRTGDSGVYCTGGNQRFSNEKYWFNGMRTDQEGVGAGLEIDGAGISNIVALGLTTQDTWGPGVVLDGNAPVIIGNIDEAGGGRLEQQEYGWSGNRTEPRSFVHVRGPAAGAKVRMSVAGGARLDAPAPSPALVYMEGSGAKNNRLEFSASEPDLSLGATRVEEKAGYTNARQVNTITLNGELLHGMLDPADIADATHPVNTENDFDQIRLTDGTLALRDGTGWTVLSGAAVVPA